MNFLIVLLPPTIVLIVAFLIWHKHYTLREVAFHFAINIALCGLFFAFTANYNIWDREILNGRVTEKKMEEVPCRHSYPCHCVTTCRRVGKTTSCTTHCKTCYTHHRGSSLIRGTDFTWAVYSDLGTRIEIDTLDSRGVQQPPRWTAVRIGEPYSIYHEYKNYIKYNPNTLFRRDGNYSSFPNPGYPGQIFDYYRINRVVNVNGVDVKDLADWEAHLSEINAELGRKKQVNMVVMLSKNLPHTFVKAVEANWLGGKKNDVITLINVNDQNEITWVDVVGFVSSNLVKVKLRDDILDLKTLEHAKVLEVIKENVNLYYKRLPMEEFEYLKASKALTSGQYFWMLILGTLISIGLAVFFVKNDETDEPRFHW